MQIKKFKWSTKNIDFLEENQLMSELRVSPYYLGNSDLKKPGIPFDYTNEELLEIEQYKLDFYKFSDSIRVKSHKIEWYAYQKDAIDEILNKRIGNIYSSRQMGWTTIMAYLTFYLMNIHDNYNIKCIFPGQLRGYHLIQLIKDLYIDQKFFAKKGIIAWNNGSIRFDNGSSIDIRSSKNFRGEEISDFIYTEGLSQMDEAVIHPQLMRFFSNKANSGFWRNSTFRNDKFNNDNKIFTTWDLIPNRDNVWKEEEINKLGENVFNLEYEPIVINMEKIREFLENEKINPSDFKEILTNL